MLSCGAEIVPALRSPSSLIIFLTNEWLSSFKLKEVSQNLPAFSKDLSTFMGFPFHVPNRSTR